MKDSQNGYSDVDVVYGQNGIVEMESAVKDGTRWVVTFRALKPGQTSATVLFAHNGKDYASLFDKYPPLKTLNPTKFPFMSINARGVTLL